MFRKKYSRLILSLVIGAVLLIVGFIYFSQQKANRDTYLSIKSGEIVEAKAIKFSDHVEGGRNKYLYIFTAKEDGNQYAGSTILKYSDIEPKADSKDLKIFVRYVVKDGKVLTIEDETEKDKPATTKINGITYELAVSYEDAYFKNSVEPGLTMSIVLIVLGGVGMAYCLYNLAWIAFYKNIERKGILTYALFIEANAAKGGSNRFMAIRYKYKDLDDNWVEATSPYTFSAITAEKLMIMETFKIRYKGKYSMIVEDTKLIRI